MKAKTRVKYKKPINFPRENNFLLDSSQILTFPLSELIGYSGMIFTQTFKQNPLVLPFKWNRFAELSQVANLFRKILQKDILNQFVNVFHIWTFCVCFPLAQSGGQIIVEA